MPRTSARRAARALLGGTPGEHHYADCPDGDDCPRYPCRVWREGYAAGVGAGYAAGQAAGFAEGYAAGASDGAAAAAEG
jgi:hypothetical protein